MRSNEVFKPHRIAVTGTALVLALVLAASTQAQPVREACDQADSGERIQCKFNNVVQQQQGVADMIGQLDEVPEIQKQAVMSEVGRASRAQGRANSMDFKLLTRKSDSTCQIKELIGDGKGDDDGLCTSGEDCEEVLGDQIGNDDGVCRPQQGANREVCVEICDLEAVGMNPENFDDDPTTNSRGRDLEESLDMLTDQFESVNEAMEQELYARATAAQRAATAEGECGVLLARRPSSNLKAVLDGAQLGARAAADVAERFCDQTAFGANTAAVCAVIEGIAGAATIAAGVVDVSDGAVDSDTIDAIWACLQETSEATAEAVGSVSDVSEDLGEVGQQVNTIDNKVDTLDTKVNAIQQKLLMLQGQLADVLVLLNTPQGQRSDFPTRR
jgi:hypothetical protein